MNRLTSDIGFADPSGARAIVRRLQLSAALKDSRASIETLLDLLNQRSDPVRRNGASLAEQGVRLLPSDEERGTGRITIDLSESDAVREEQLLEGVKMVLQLLDRLGIGVRHGLFSFDHAHEPIPADPERHSLSGGAK